MKTTRVVIAVTACLIAAGLGLVAAAVVRGLGGNPVVTTSPTARGSSQGLPSSPVSPSARRQALGAACLIHEVHGDYDGDGLEDAAFTWMAEPAEGCPSDPPFGPFLLTVFPASRGERLELQMTDRCDGESCGYLAKADLNGDGKDELAAVTWTGAADDFYHVFGVMGGRLVALPVASPGAKGYPPDAPLELDVGGSALIQSFVTCEDSDEWGGMVLLAHGFVGKADAQGQVRWSQSETAFRLDGKAFTVLYQDPQEGFPPSYDPSRDRLLQTRKCWPTPP